ncbi:MAG: TolC family protein [Gammaproteobacteria bacterium]
MVSITCCKRVTWLLLLAASGCVTVPADLGRSDVDELVAERGWSIPPRQAEQLQTLLAEPLTATSAVRIALLNNPSLHSELAGLGFGAADVYAAGRLSNPSLSGAWLDADRSGEGTQRTLGLVLPFTDLLTLPARSKMAQLEFAALKSAVAGAAIEVATDAEAAFYQLVADQRVRVIHARRATAAKLSAELAQRFYVAGNINDRELAEHRVAAAAAQLERLQTDTQVQSSRAHFAGLLGVSTALPWRVETTLQQPPLQERPLQELEALAQAQRLDLLAARAEASALAQRVGFVGWSRWLGDLDLGIEREREADGTRLSGPTLELEIPVFNQHRDDLLIADASLAQAAAKLTALALQVENDVRLAYAGIENARARVATYQDSLIPAYDDVVARTQEEVNFMLTGVFELLDVKQEQLAAHEGYLRSVSGYWIARAQLAKAVGISLPVTPGEAVEIELPQEGNDHQHHQNHGDSP